MPQNLEIKIKMNSFKNIILVLEKLNAEFEATLNQKDVYYKINNFLLKLRIQNGSSQLIKYNRDETAAMRWSDYDLLDINDHKAETFFSGIFTEEITVEKKRDLWMYNNTRIHLDDVKELGKFLELETLVINGQKDAEERFNFLIKKLELNFGEQIRKSYRNLMLEKSN